MNEQEQPSIAPEPINPQPKVPVPENVTPQIRQLIPPVQQFGQNPTQPQAPQTPSGYSMPLPPEAVSGHSGIKPTYIIAGAIVLVTVIVGAFFLTKGDKDGSSASTTKKTTASKDDRSSNGMLSDEELGDLSEEYDVMMKEYEERFGNGSGSFESTTDSNGAQSATSETAINAAISDTATGNIITATKLVRNFPIDKAQFSSIASTREAILLYVTLSPDVAYGSSLTTSSLRLVTANGQVVASGGSSDFEKSVQAAGYKLLGNKTATGGQSVSGYVVFLVPEKNSTTLTLRHSRIQLRILGGGGTIPAQTFNVTLQ